MRRAEGKPIPTELRAEEAALRDQASLEDVRTAAVSTHVDDEYARAGEEDPRIMLTTSRNPSTRLTAFVKELKLVFPNCTRLNRGGQVVKEMVESCRAGGYSDIIVVHEHRGEPDGLVVCHLPFGPTAYFGLMNCVARHDIKDTALGTVSEAYPHLILEARWQRVRCAGACADAASGASCAGLFVGAGHPREQRVEAPVPGAQGGQARDARAASPLLLLADTRASLAASAWSPLRTRRTSFRSATTPMSSLAAPRA